MSKTLTKQKEDLILDIDQSQIEAAEKHSTFNLPTEKWLKP